MNFHIFLKNIYSTAILEESKNILFRSEGEYPLLFFSLIYQKIKQSSKHVQIISDTQDFASLVSQLGTTFLGQSTIFIVPDLNNFDTALRSKIISFLVTYTGPHTIIWYMKKEQEIQIPTLQSMSIDIPAYMDKREIVHIAESLFVRNLHNHVTAFLKYQKKVTLEQAVLLLHYFAIVGNGMDDFMHKWFDTLILPEQSLFSLSQYFFARDGIRFFPLWKQLSSRYGTQFWISFWSEQLWRAGAFVALSNKKKFADAKRISYKLPFSFMQKDWQKTTYHELEKAHDMLYAYDGRIKNGGDERVIELFYADYLAGTFKN